ncbi:flagellar hook-length control protein FliK [Legionella fairfieldensis]|uniref:flagellar hook-length control protein FliK n=1 Tax=Legionella fairfieldensis TaxID=45064 RepID=UPI00048CF9F3|nr:flagellar hook-length control protein FliK [Legionella fairfieldensis]
MAVDFTYTPTAHLFAGEELKLTKPGIKLYVGQILKAKIVKRLSENQIIISIDDEVMNAQTSHHLESGDLLEAKVAHYEDGIAILQILRETSQALPFIGTALAQTLPKQAPANHLLASLSALTKTDSLPLSVRGQIDQILSSIASITQLQQLAPAVASCGLFWESSLLDWRKTHRTGILQHDFKGQCLRLLASLIKEGAQPANPVTPTTQSELLPLPGAIPQPLPRLPLPTFTGLSTPRILHILREQTEQVLARIKTSQLTHLLQTNDQPFNLMLDFPLHTDTGIDIIPLLIKESPHEKSELPSAWSITFAINLATLGDIQAKIKLQDSAIDVHLNVDKQETIELLAANQQAFDALLTNAGLTLRLWCLHSGLETHDIETCDLRLLDVRI